MTLGFANPALAWGLLAAAIPVAIHLFYRRRPKPTLFPAIDFILRARKETERRLRLKKLLLFVARTALLAAIALALMRPRAESPDAAAMTPRGPSAAAIVLDASASMAYRLAGRTLFERARADALDALDGLGSDEPATVLVCGGTAVPSASPPSFDRASARTMLRGAEPTFGHADLTACVAAAARALSDSATGHALASRIIVATDMTASAWRLDAPPPMVETARGRIRPEVTLLDAARGAPLPNGAVTELTADPDPAVGPRGYRITATISNHSKEPLHDVPVQLRIGTGPGATTPIRGFADVPPGGTIKKTLSYAFPAGGTIPISVAIPPDALDLDDMRFLAVHVPREVRALVVDGSPSPVKYRDEAFFVEAALASPASPVRPTVIDAEALPGARLADYDVVLLLNVRSVGAKAAGLQSFVERGGGLFIALGDEVDPERYNSELKALLPRPLHLVKTAAERGTPGALERAARFADLDWEHPALAIFAGPAREGLEGVRTFRYMLLKPANQGRQAPTRVLASYDDGAPALVEAHLGQGRVILYTSTVDREWSDWTIRTSFLPAMQRLAAYLGGALEERSDPPSPVLAPRELALPEGARLVALVGPDGRERSAASLAGGATLRGRGQRLTITPDRPGLWQVKLEESGAVRLDPRLAFAVLPDPRESDTTRLDPSELTAYFGGAVHARIAGEPSGGAGRAVPLWSILLAVAVAAFFAEGLLVA